VHGRGSTPPPHTIFGKQSKIEMREGNIIILILLLKSYSYILNAKGNLSKIL
jgi:hypothetical protein